MQDTSTELNTVPVLGGFKQTTLTGGVVTDFTDLMQQKRGSHVRFTIEGGTVRMISDGENEPTATTGELRGNDSSPEVWQMNLKEARLTKVYPVTGTPIIQTTLLDEDQHAIDR